MSQFYEDLRKFAQAGDVDCIRTMLDSPEGCDVKRCFLTVLSTEASEEVFHLFLGTKGFELDDDDYLDEALKHSCVRYFEERLKESSLRLKSSSLSSELYPNLLARSVTKNLSVLIYLVQSGLFEDQVDKALFELVMDKHAQHEDIALFLAHPSVKPLFKWSDERLE